MVLKLVQPDGIGYGIEPRTWVPDRRLRTFPTTALKNPLKGSRYVWVITDKVRTVNAAWYEVDLPHHEESVRVRNSTIARIDGDAILVPYTWARRMGVEHSGTVYAVDEVIGDKEG